MSKSSETFIYFLLLYIALKLNVISNVEFVILMLGFILAPLIDSIYEYVVHKHNN